MKKKIVLTSVLTLLLLFVVGNTALAVNEDPGSGRLSGSSISSGFYDDDPEAFSTVPEENPVSLSEFGRYGSFTSVSPYTGNTYSHQDIFADRTLVNGIDVSQWQGTINWKQVKKAGIDFAFIRVGYRGYGSGLLDDSTMDTYYETNMKNAIAAGIKVGVYVFSQAVTKKEAIAEANYILNRIGNYEISMPLILDYEYASTETGLGGRLYNANLTKKQATNICLAFCQTIADAGYTPMVYANKSMLETQLNADTISKDYRIWLANYTTETTYGKTFDFWQYSSTGSVKGISGNVDMNFYYEQLGDSFAQNANSISSVTVARIPNQIYTGKKITPALKLTHDGKTLKEGEDYTVIYSDNKKIGTAAVTIAGINEYRNVRTATFKILPKTMGSVKAKKRTANAITLSWERDSSVTGYQIYCSSSLNGSYKKAATISSNKTTAFQHAKLQAGTCCYYKIRAYKTVGGANYFGAFSPVKALYTKTGYSRTATAKRKTALYPSASDEDTAVLTLPKGTKASVTYSTQDEYGNIWYYVTCQTGDKKSKGYVPAGRVSVTMTGKVAGTAKVNVRKSYSTGSSVLTTLARGKKVTVTSVKTKNGVLWYKVTFSKNKKVYTGWISSPYLKLI